MVIRVVSLIILFLSLYEVTAQFETSNRQKCNSCSILVGSGFFVSNASSVEANIPSLSTGLLLEHNLDKNCDLGRTALAFYYMRLPYDISYYSAGGTEFNQFIWRTSEQINTHSLQIGISMNVLYRSKNQSLRTIKVVSLGGFNFLENTTETRDYQFQKENSSNIWLPSDRRTQAFRSNQNSDVRQWRVSLMASYGVERKMDVNRKLSYSLFIMAATGGSPTGPFLSFENLNNFPMTSDGRPRLQIMSSSMYIIGIKVEMFYSTFKKEEF